MKISDWTVLIAIVGSLGFFNLPLLAQDTNFSGAWALDVEASELPQPSSGRGGGGRRGSGGRGPGAGPTSLTITQTDRTLTMSQTGRDGQSRTVTYQLDASESTNPGPRGGNLTTLSSWKGRTLVTEGSQEISTQRGNFTFELVEHRSLSNDGQTMTVQTTRSTPRGDRSVSLVYRKDNN